MAVISTNHKGEVVKSKETANDDEQAPSTSLTSMNRDELEEHATQLGVDNPGDFANKAELIAAIEDAGGTP